MKSSFAMASFFGIRIDDCEKVYNPADDTILIAECIDAVRDKLVLDMGTGSGLLGLRAARMGARVIAVDISEFALRCAQQNARQNGIKNIIFRISDLFSMVTERFDLIIFNPPYVPTEEWEPHDAESMTWDGGLEGRDLIDRLLRHCKDHLVDGGRLLMIGSSLSDYNMTIEILIAQGFDVSVVSRKKLDFEELVVISGKL